MTATTINAGLLNATGTTSTTTFTGSAATILSAVPSQGTCSVSGRVVTCTPGTVDSGAGATVKITLEPSTTGTVTATTVAHATQPDLNPADNTATQSETIPKGNGCTLTGTPGNNILVGIGHQVICGLGGNDVIHAGSYLHPRYRGPRSRHRRRHRSRHLLPHSRRPRHQLRGHHPLASPFGESRVVGCESSWSEDPAVGGLAPSGSG
ncbi:hypothetical protein [Streptomyces sp. NBC_01198]|uniref:hypothetical protein n=1 Tax=Streptomyces sp. NBC_01198 TaxID=2903769 RepID=UPI003FA3A78A